MFLDEIAARLASEGVGTIGGNIILASKGQIPSGPGPYLTLIQTGGMSPLRVHNEDRAHVKRPSAQVLVRAKNAVDAKLMAARAYDALDGVFNTVLSGTFYQKIVAAQEPGDIGLDAEKRIMISFNIDVEKQPS